MILLFVVLLPIAAALAILLGAPARQTALWSAGLTLGATLLLFPGFDGGQRDYQMVSSFPISADWNINFTVGLDGLSLMMLLLTALVTFAAVWFTGSLIALLSDIRFRSGTFLSLRTMVLGLVILAG